MLRAATLVALPVGHLLCLSCCHLQGRMGAMGQQQAGDEEQHINW